MFRLIHRKGWALEINLNNPTELTVENVRKLIAAKSDNVRCQLRVTKAGQAYLSEVVGNTDTADLAFSLDTWLANSGRKGQKASEDDEWVLLVYECLKSNWPKPSSTYIDMDEYSGEMW